MTTAIEYALMAGASYVSTRSETNLIPVPEGWLEPLGTHQVLSSGFEATQYTNGSEIVISFAGTGPGASDWIHGNIPLALGLLSDQLRQAADYYLEVKASAPEGTTISFTGHSLGGGLASLVAVMFGESAFTFDQAPFRNAALTTTVEGPDGNLVPVSAALDLRAYLQGRAPASLLAPLDAYIAANDPSNSSPVAADTFAGRAARVTDINVQGEILSFLPFSRIGAQADIPQRNDMFFPGVDLHSQALLTAFLQSNQTAPSFKGLSEVTFKLNDLLGMIFDNALFARSTASTEPNLLEHLVRHEAGVDGSFETDGMVTRFTSDQWKIAKDGGLTLLAANVRKALMAFDMQKYYEETDSSEGYGRELFTDLGSGLRFDIADVSAKFATAFAGGDKLNLTDAKGYDKYFKNYVSNNFGAGESELIRFVLPYMRDWYVQAGADAMAATDTSNRGAFMLGGSGADTLTGGAANDLLVGNSGNDILDGGAGNDFLLGGAGNDTYVYTSGFDTILDSDGSGSITIGGAALTGGAQYGDNRVYRDGGGNLYVKVGSNRLVIAGKVLIEQFQTGQFGLTMTGPTADTVPPIETTETIKGDMKPKLKSDGKPQTDIWGNIVPDDGQSEANREDEIFDTFVNDHIIAGGGNDLVWKVRGGDDIIELNDGDDEFFTTVDATGRVIANGGAGRDYLGAGSGRDLIEGGADADGLYGSADDDLIYGDTRGNTQTYISQGSSQQGNGSQGEWVDAEDGNDKVFTGAGKDLIAGGAGDDLLVSGGGDDYIAGDWNTIAQSDAWRDWTVTRQSSTNGDGSTRYTYDIAIVETESDAGTGNDVIYAGGGDDAVFGERGDDVLFGEDGSDWLVGGEGNDVILGGIGQDFLSGDGDSGGGADYLDGGDGADELRGNDGNDILVGGAGNDTLYGGEGSDIYIFNRGDGNDTVIDTRAGNNIFRFGDGISSSNVTLRLGSLLLDLGGGDAIHIGGFDQTDAFNSSSIGSFEFADGTTLSLAELLERGFDLSGTEGDDSILGTDATDRIDGLGGNDFIDGAAGDDMLMGGAGADLLEGGDGDDTLIGDAGADVLRGGAGNDRFVADLADGDVVVDDAGGANVLQVAYSGEVSALSIFQAGDAEGNTYLVLTDGAGGQVAIQGGFAGAVSDFDFGGASTVARADLMRQAQVSALNLTGSAGSQHFIAGGSADFIDGGAGADIMEGNAGDDSYVVDDAGDVIVENAGEGLDSVQSSASRTLEADVENMTLTGTSAIDATGNASDNTLTGNAAANTLDGGAGNDVLAGGFGADTYLFGVGSGQDVIQESDDGSNAVDKVQFAANVAPADVAVTRTASDLVLTITASGDRITVANYFVAPAAIVEQFRFADGTIWNEATIAQKLSNGTPGNDIISGTAGNDLLNGLAGNDTISGLNGDDRLFGEQGFDTLNGNNGADILDGGADADNLLGGNGADTYIFARGYGTDFIGETDDGTNAVDRVQFAADILSTDVTARRNGSNLELTINGTADKLTIGSYFNNDAVGPQVVEQLRFGDGVIWDVATVKALALLPTAGNDTLTGYASDDVINGGAGADFIDGQGGNDTLNGGGGNDTLNGGAGSDTYIYNLGDGSDTINNNDASPTSTDRLVFGPGILPANAFLARNGTISDLFVGQVKISGYFSSLGGANEVDEIRFTDDPGTVWTVAAVRAMLLAANDNANTLLGYDTNDTIDGLGGDDFIRGDAGNDTLFGSAGNDTVRGDTGNDQIDGGTGDDFLYGNAGSDVITGGAGNDQLYGEEFDSQFEAPGGDTLDGGAGKDFLAGRRGNDTYVFGRGYGHDTVDEGFASDGTDTLRLNAGVLPADVSLFRHADDLVVTFAGDQAQAWITQYFTLANKPIEQIVFNDGTVWDAAAITAHLTATAANAFTGTSGNDTFVVDHVGDTITEGLNQGTDTVQSSVTYTLPANVENITLTGILDVNAFGNALNNTVTGNVGDNWLTGGDGNDTLNGGAGDDSLQGDAGDDTLNGGAGNDRLDGGAGTSTLAGGLGDDTYVLNTNGSETITEAAGEGIDTVIAWGSYTLGANLENLTVQSRSIFVSTYTGNALDNVITGDSTVVNDNYDGGLGADTVIVRSGTITVDNVNDQVIVIDGNSTFIKSKVDWTLGGNQASLELLTLTAATNGTGNAANNALAGNERANTLRGLDGNDILFGATAADTLIGGLGNDTYVLADFRTVASNGNITYGVSSAASVNEDTIVEAANEGIDTVRSFFSYTLADNLENLDLLQTTTIFPVAGTGNALANRITGNQAANVIDGREGADTMIGGLGSDTYYVDNAGDVVSELAGGGTADTVNASVSYTLGAEVENLALTGSSAISGAGNALGNVIDGSQNSAGNVLAGGLGDDTYIVGAGDTIVENAGEGIDTVRSDVSYTLGANVENLVLVGSAATTGTGDSLANTLDGSQNAAANTLVGGLGDDTYVVDSGDVIVENAGEGVDTARAAFDYTLSANVENLTLAGGAVSGTGNADANVITGNSSDNVLNGGGGTDTLRGMGGSDTYIVDDASDVVDEIDPSFGGDAGGIDTVRASFTYTLGAQIENLVLTDGSAIDGTGNALDNTLTGNGAANVLDGGAGADTLIGGAGDDTYRFARGAGNDVISEADATAGNLDTIEMAAGIAVADVTGARVGNDLVLSIAGASDTLTLSSFYASSANEIERVVFADGTVWDVNALKNAVGIRGTAGADTLNGTAGDDSIYGLAGNDTLNGNAGNDFLDGGAGTDTMVGGLGDDTYVVDVATDVTTEASNAGIDTIQTSITLSLASTSPSRANIENLVLTGTANIDATGNTLNNVLTGNGGNNTLNGGTGTDTMAGGLGNDTYVVDNVGDVVTENVNEGVDTVQSSVTYTLTVNVENLTLTATTAINGTGNALDNVLTGGSGNNTLSGGAGNDTLNGGAGTDTLVGGTGDDVYIVDTTTDTITELANEGTDTVQSSITFTLGSNNVENLTLTGTSVINGTGNALNNVLTGNIAANTLNGGAGLDTMIGGQGNDTYVVDNAGDVVVENAGEGTDLVQSAVTYTLSANVENLTLTATTAIDGTGNALNNVLTGGSGNNTLTGGAGNDTLNGGAGIDTLVGGTGNDVYVVDSATDTITELANEGTDLVQSSVTYTLSANVENLTLTATTAINGTGNALDNVLTGGSGNNTLTGGAGNDTLDGGAGTDTMVGGTGDDTYVVNVTTDVVTEALNEGIDTVQSIVTYTLGANLENLTLTGTNAINGTGNALNNVLAGNAGNNTLTGLGGNDIYFVGAGTDTVVEAANGGEDLINSSIAVTALAANVEHLVLTGTSAINGTGNTLNNLLRGNAGANTLNGGSAGNDVLEGGDGNDILTIASTGKNLLNGQGGADTLNGGTGNELLIGGTGNDTVNTSSGADIIAFNRGDGADTVAVSTVKDNSLSLGGGISYADLFFQKSGNNLILKTAGAAGTEQITFTNWYAATANRSVLNLQVVAEAMAQFDAGSADPLLNKKVARFNFDGLVTQFDAALAANPGLTSWALTNALTSFHLGGSDTDALGGDLAYRYGLQNNLAAVGTVGAQNVLAGSQFGSATQAFQSLPLLQDGVTRLS